MSNSASKIVGSTISILSRVLDFRSAKHHVISGNLSNADTPGYKPKEVSFDAMLKNASNKHDLRLKTTDPGHMSPNMEISGERFPVTTSKEEYSESASMNIETEMVNMMENNLKYEAAVTLLNKKFLALKTVLDPSRG